MPYVIGDEHFSKKSEITDKCRHILHSTNNGDFVPFEYLSFLFGLFRYHDEWDEKSGSGVVGISKKMTEHGTPCFILVNKSGESIDISFNHAIKLIPTKRTANLTPQKLFDFKNAARTAIKPQIDEYRNAYLKPELFCPATGCKIDNENCSVDHIFPDTFDQILFDFVKEENINPLTTNVDSTNGVIAEFESKNIESRWQKYHKQRAKLRLLSKAGNLQLPKAKVNWLEVI